VRSAIGSSLDKAPPDFHAEIGSAKPIRVFRLLPAAEHNRSAEPALEHRQPARFDPRPARPSICSSPAAHARRQSPARPSTVEHPTVQGG
jgi:hypothetical protein